VTVIVEGAIILSKALNDKGLMGSHTRLFRHHVKLVIGPDWGDRPTTLQILFSASPATVVRDPVRRPVDAPPN